MKICNIVIVVCDILKNIVGFKGQIFSLHLRDARNVWKLVIWQANTKARTSYKLDERRIKNKQQFSYEKNFLTRIWIFYNFLEKKSLYNSEEANWRPYFAPPLSLQCPTLSRASSSHTTKKCQYRGEIVAKIVSSRDIWPLIKSIKDPKDKNSYRHKNTSVSSRTIKCAELKEK